MNLTLAQPPVLVDVDEDLADRAAYVVARRVAEETRPVADLARDPEALVDALAAVHPAVALLDGLLRRRVVVGPHTLDEAQAAFDHLDEGRELAADAHQRGDVPIRDVEQAVTDARTAAELLLLLRDATQPSHPAKDAVAVGASVAERLAAQARLMIGRVGWDLQATDPDRVDAIDRLLEDVVDLRELAVSLREGRLHPDTHATRGLRSLRGYLAGLVAAADRVDPETAAQDAELLDQADVLLARIEAA